MAENVWLIAVVLLFLVVCAFFVQTPIKHSTDYTTPSGTTFTVTGSDACAGIVEDGVKYGGDGDGGRC